MFFYPQSVDSLPEEVVYEELLAQTRDMIDRSVCTSREDILVVHRHSCLVVYDISENLETLCSVTCAMHIQSALQEDKMEILC